MSTTIQPKDTTVALTISADQLAALVQQLCAEEPTAAARIQRGAGYLLAGHVHRTAELCTFKVLGCDGRIYRTSSGSCDCADSVQRQVCCKHSWSARILSAASAIAAFDRAQARWELTLKGTRGQGACGRA